MLGNASDCGNQWVGRLFGLALYRGVLTSEQLHRNYLSWTQSDQVDVELSGNPMVLYTFDEKQGRRISNRAGDKNHLIVPKRYRPLKRIMLQPSWKHTSVVDRGFLSDVIINVLGFIPFAFLLIHYLNTAGRIPLRRLVFAVVLVGALTSLVIEGSQAYLPTRHSSLLDLICNTCGAYFGVLLYKIVCRKPFMLRPSVAS
jgi:VanZ family protein